MNSRITVIMVLKKYRILKNYNKLQQSRTTSFLFRWDDKREYQASSVAKKLSDTNIINHLRLFNQLEEGGLLEYKRLDEFVEDLLEMKQIDEDEHLILHRYLEHHGIEEKPVDLKFILDYLRRIKDIAKCVMYTPTEKGNLIFREKLFIDYSEKRIPSGLNHEENIKNVMEKYPLIARVETYVILGLKSIKTWKNKIKKVGLKELFVKKITNESLWYI